MNRRAWLVVGLLVLFQIVNFADKAVIGLVSKPAMRDLGLSASQFGFIGSASTSCSPCPPSSSASSPRGYRPSGSCS
ncbi:hypothetical protein [Tomitella fengzijianii]|uniref:hypothetical protein n=1 Tax=Tomitella fengzijianii TaxID=2597660 RepID=UPI0018EEDA53|nr:hypothetical protein [Tomitella fengzijianii]